MQVAPCGTVSSSSAGGAAFIDTALLLLPLSSDIFRGQNKLDGTSVLEYHTLIRM
jgi:hypothetical protein